VVPSGEKQLTAWGLNVPFSRFNPGSHRKKNSLIMARALPSLRAGTSYALGFETDFLRLGDFPFTPSEPGLLQTEAPPRFPITPE